MAEEVKSASEQQKEDWMNSKWRPAMGWMYMLTCITDFVLFPILWSLLQTVMKQPVTQWQPLTLQGAGLFHIAMGAVLGLAAWGRTQEKLGGANNGGVQTPATGFQGGSPAFGQPQSGGYGSSGGFNSPAPSSFGGGGFGSAPTTPSTSFAPAPSWGSTSTSSFGVPAVTASGKKIVPQDQDPVL